MLKVGNTKKLHILVDQRALLGEVLRWKLSSGTVLITQNYGLIPTKYKEGHLLMKNVELSLKKIRNEMDQDSSSHSQSISKDDPLGKAFGKEHPERVRGLGFGPFPSKVFNNTSSSSNDNQMKEYVANLEKELAATKAQLQVQNDMQKAMGGALVAILEKTFGKVPEQFVTLLNQTSQPDPWWNPAVEEQAIMRIHRIGQKRTVCVRRFIVKETVEERMQYILRLKTEDDARALTDYEVRSTRIEELKMLFR
nr:putative SWI/SNF-related matrix-associated actin-dependent regulator of chromatin subfamily A member 3-like 3 [Ipomoea batatas]